MDTVQLSNGHQMPSIGFGTWQIPALRTKEMVLAALEAGYRHIDTAEIYGNQIEVGQAIKESGIPRKEIFVTTKLWNNDQGYDRALKACAKSLEKLGLDYVDLYLIHWPASVRRHESWRAMEKMSQDGIIKSAGVSNYTIEHLEELLQKSDYKPMVNQVEFHPFIYEQQRAVLEYCQRLGIVVEAYSPINRVASKAGEPIKEIAKRLDKTPQQVALRWCKQHDTVPLPRSTNVDHIASNLQINDFELAPQDMLTLDSISDGHRVTWDPAGMG